jgi:hypothetical protein
MEVELMPRTSYILNVSYTMNSVQHKCVVMKQTVIKSLQNHCTTNNDACTYEASKCSSACTVLDSEDNGTVVPYHIHVSHVELNASSVCKYFHTCNKQSGSSYSADGHDDKVLTSEIIHLRHSLPLDTEDSYNVNLKDRKITSEVKKVQVFENPQCSLEKNLAKGDAVGNGEFCIRSKFMIYKAHVVF